MTSETASALQLEPRRDEIAEDDQYRRLSPWALVALVLGLASPLSLVHPLLLLIPAFAVAVGLFALSIIRRDPQRISGVAAAMTGVVAGLFFACFIGTRSLRHEALLVEKAREHAETWMDLLATSKNDEMALLQAHQLFLQHERRQPPDADLHLYYRTPMGSKTPTLETMVDPPLPLDELHRAFNAEPLKSLVSSLQDGGKYRFLRAGAGRQVGDAEQQSLHFLVTHQTQHGDHAHEHEREYVIVLKRRSSRDGPSGLWDLDGVVQSGAPLPPPT